MSPRTPPVTEQDAFGEELADDAGASCAHGGADGELALAAGGADEEQVGDVGAGDEEDKADGSEKDEERGARAGNDGITEGLDAEAVVRTHVVGVFATVGVGGELELGIGLIDGDAVVEAAGDEEEVA